MLSQEMQDRLTRLEEKGLIRRVRTPAGVAKYGQPLGSIIIRDVLPTPGSRGSKKNRASVDRAIAAGRGSRPKKTPELKELSELKWKPMEGQSTMQEAKWGNLTIQKLPSNPMGWNKDITKYYFEVGGKRIGTSIDVYNDDLERGERKIVRNINRNREAISAKRTPRKTDAFIDYWEGIYGVDWQYEDDEYNPETVEDIETRLDASIAESEALGITIEDGELGGRAKDAYFDQDVRETINATARAYEEMYAGFTKYQNRYYMGKEGRAIGWNGVDHWNRAEDGGQKTQMGFSTEYWSMHAKNRPVEMLTELKRRSMGSWHSVENLDKVSEDLGLDDWRLAMLATINHEMGHTVGRMVFGELSNPKIDAQEQRKAYAEAVTPILLKYGIISDASAIEHADTTSIWNTGGGQKGFPTAGWSKENLSRHLSEYGSTNMHEMMAETWASFMLDPRPTEFVQEMGLAIEQLLINWLGDVS